MLTGKFCILFKCYNDLVLNRWHTIIERIMILRFWASELILMLGAINVGIRPAKSNILIQLTRCTAPCETVSGISLVLMQLVISFVTTYLGPLPMCWVHSYVTYLIPMCSNQIKSNQISLLPCQYTIWWEAYINSYTAMGDIEASAYWCPVLIKVLLKLTMAMFYIITT